MVWEWNGKHATTQGQALPCGHSFKCPAQENSPTKKDAGNFTTKSQACCGDTTGLKQRCVFFFCALTEAHVFNKQC